jgi:hypothetical protein
MTFFQNLSLSATQESFRDEWRSQISRVGFVAIAGLSFWYFWDKPKVQSCYLAILFK